VIKANAARCFSSEKENDPQSNPPAFTGPAVVEGEGDVVDWDSDAARAGKVGR
jgi:hypothetical protein